MYAENASTQAPKWTVNLKEPITMSPVTTANGLVVILTAAGHLIGLNSTTGARVFIRTLPPAVQQYQYSGNETGVSVGRSILIAPSGTSLVAFR